MSVSTSSAPGTVALDISGLEVIVPRRFQAGQVLTENQAKVLDAAYQRQFTNNQVASAKSRAEALAKATTDAERAAKAPLTAEQIAALYTDYEPNVGGTPRQSVMEKMRQEAAWRFWTQHVAEHNEAVANGQKPVIERAGSKPVNLPRAFTTPEGVKVTAQEQKDALIARLLLLPAYAEPIQVHLDAIMAERGKDKTDAPEAVRLTADDLI